ncbi:MAG TPA: alpha-glucosidase/alpha-galactosidase [Roseiflexaceae bacterium]|nr:alpha-glucosidase/alpha-galactosidase [Roseiflexaceae bacterium]HMP41515.1 alpha-glucosidase/alpha-galactosidase [Roseiflexaceae bacterium]
MAKITFIGAGSTVFAKNLMGDILSFPELADSTLTLFDIDEERLRTSEIVARKVARVLGANPTIETTTDRRRALDGADYAICMIQVGGYRPSTVIDFEIPKKYGLRQTIADTLGIGGIMRGLRTVPVLLSMCRDMEELCPDVTFLQYVNPMAINCWAISRATSINTVGLCHSVQGTAEQLADDIGVPLEEINYIAAGINHMAFYLRFERDGVDLYPEIRKVVTEGRIPDWNRVRYEIFQRVGHFVTESSEHFSEYTPWFIKRDRPDLIEAFNIPLDEYIRRCENQIAGWHKMRALYESDEPIEVHRSHEYGSLIIHSMETGTPRVIYGNVANQGLIDNLPQGCCVEVPVLVDKSGLQPTKIGRLPPQLAAMMQTNINVQSLTVEAALTGKREHIYHAAMLDPHTAAELSLDQIWSLVDDLIEAHGDWLPAYQ